MNSIDELKNQWRNMGFSESIIEYWEEKLSKGNEEFMQSVVAGIWGLRTSST